MKIILDVNGGDHAPNEILKGVCDALKEDKALELVLVGTTEEITSELTKLGADLTRIEIIEGENVEHLDDAPTAIVRGNPNASICKAMETLKNRDDIGGFVGAGNTGVVLTVALLRLGRMRGFTRPVHSASFPRFINGEVSGRVVIGDCGANVDCKPEMIVQFALIASEFSKVHYKIEKPRVGLLNVGVEEAKGNEVVKQVYQMLKARTDINFVGNCEARDVLTGGFDVVVGDGFAGNMVIKSIEGTGMALLKAIKNAIMGSFVSKIGGLLIKGQLNKVKNSLDFNKYGGAYLLGCNKVVCKCHGASKAESIKIAILETRDIIASGINENFKVLAEKLDKESVND